MTTAAKNTLAIDGVIRRTRTNGNDFQMALARSMYDLTDVQPLEITLAAGVAGRAVNFNGIVPKALIIKTPQKIDLNLPGGSSIECASLFILMDTSIASLTLDNDRVSPAAACIVEVWIAQ